MLISTTAYSSQRDFWPDFWKNWDYFVHKFDISEARDSKLNVRSTSKTVLKISKKCF